MAAGVFDATLEKYKPPSINKSNRLLGTQINLFIQAKQRQVYHRTLEKYETTGKQILEYFGNIAIAQIDITKAEGFAARLETPFGRYYLQRATDLCGGDLGGCYCRWCD